MKNMLVAIIHFGYRLECTELVTKEDADRLRTMFEARGLAVSVVEKKDTEESS